SLERLTADKVQHSGAVVEMPHFSTCSGNQPPDSGHELRGDGLSCRWCKGCDLDSAEGGLALTRTVLQPAFSVQPTNGAIDDLQSGFVTLFRSVTPGEEAVGLEDDTLGLRVFANKLLQCQPEGVSRAQPRQPADLLAIDLAGECVTVGRGGNRDDGVRVHVVDVSAVDQAVQRGINAGGAGIQVESAVSIERHQYAVIWDIRCHFGEGPEPIHVQGREPVELNCSEVTTGTLDPEDFDLSA